MDNRPYLRTILGGTGFRSLSLFEKYYALMFGYYAYANVMQKRYENEKGGKYVKFVFTVFNIP